MGLAKGGVALSEGVGGGGWGAAGKEPELVVMRTAWWAQIKQSSARSGFADELL